MLLSHFYAILFQIVFLDVPLLHAFLFCLVRIKCFHHPSVLDLCVLLLSYVYYVSIAVYVLIAVYVRIAVYVLIAVYVRIAVVF
jgi:hypothetical protein